MTISLAHCSCAPRHVLLFCIGPSVHWNTYSWALVPVIRDAIQSAANWMWRPELLSEDKGCQYPLPNPHTPQVHSAMVWYTCEFLGPINPLTCFSQMREVACYWSKTILKPCPMNCEVFSINSLEQILYSFVYELWKMFSLCLLGVSLPASSGILT